MLGSPFANGYWDDDTHRPADARRPARELGGRPLHDLSVRVTGTVVRELSAIFKEWWEDVAEHAREGADRAGRRQTNDSGRKCYRVAVVYAKDNIHSSGTVYFDKASFMVFHITGDRQLPDGSHTYLEQVLDFDMKPGDFDSIVLKNHKIYSENKQLKLPRYLSEEHTFSVYKTMTHPPETFRLEQFGLPDVAERPRATSRRSIGFVIAGVALGGFLLVAWLRGRRAAKTA